MALCSLFLILTSMGCGDNGTNPTSAPYESELSTGRLSVATVIGGTESVDVLALDGWNQPEDFTAVCSDPTIATVSRVGNAVDVVGAGIGEATVTITSDSGKKSTLPILVYDPRVMDCGDLQIAFTDQFEIRWDDHGSGGTYFGNFYHPIPPSGFHAVGTLGFGDNSYYNPNGKHWALVVKAKSGTDAVAYPIDYQLLYNDQGSGAEMFGSFWIPIPPSSDYVPMGIVVSKNTWSKPSLTDVVCVRKDLTEEGRAGAFIYNDSKTGAEMFLGTWRIAPPVSGQHEKAYLATGAFVAVNGWTAPNGIGQKGTEVMHVLKVDFPMLEERNLDTYKPRLTSHDPPGPDTQCVVARAMLVPFTCIDDPAKVNNLHWVVTNSPFYRLERQVHWNCVFHHDNDQSMTVTKTYAYTHGVTDTESNTWHVNTGISVTYEAGCEFKPAGVSASVSCTFSLEFGYSQTSSIASMKAETITTSIPIPPHKAAALWAYESRYQLWRHNGAELESVGNPMLFNDSESTYSSEYPPSD